MSWFRDLLVTPECMGCGTMGFSVCASCHCELRPVDLCVGDLNVNCVSDYSGWLRDRIIDYKNGLSHLARPLAELMSEHISSNAILIPIPTSRAKVHARGFDTVGLLCKELTRLEPGRRLMPALRQSRNVLDQVGLNESQRRTNLAYAFTATLNISHDVVVIDDVVTTGATLDEARRALLIAGAREVTAAVLCGSPKKRYG